jgi:hypothetical protein
MSLCTELHVARAKKEEEHDPRRDGKTSLRDAAIEHFAQVVQVTGTRTTVDGQKALYVQGFVKQ